MPSNIAVKITADVIDLQTKFAVARAESSALNAELNKLARTATSTGMSDSLKSGLTAAATASSAAQVKVASLRKELSAFNEETGHGSIATATREFRALFDELSSGRTRMTPGTLAIIATRVFGISGATLGAVGGVVALTAGLAYLGYEALKDAKNLDDLAKGFEMTGRGADMSRAAVEYNLGFLARLPGSTNEAAQGFMKLAAEHADWTAEAINKTGQFMPAFVATYGKDAPQAIGKLTEAISHLTLEGFQKLDRETLNLAPSQYEMIENLIKTGDTATAVSAILEQLSKHSGTYIKTLGDQVYDIQQEIQATKTAIEGMEKSGQGDGIANLIGQLGSLEDKLKGVRDLERNAGKQQADTHYKDEIDSARKINTELDKKGTILQEITKLYKDAAEAQKRGDAGGQADFNSAIKSKQAELTKIQEEEENKRTAAARRESAKRAAATREAAQQEIATAREKISEINADETRGGEKRIADIKAVYAGLLSSANLSAAQRKNIQKEENDAIAASNRKAAADQLAIARSTATTELELAKIGFQERRSLLEADVASGRITKEQELQQLIQIAEEEKKTELAALDAEKKGVVEGTVTFIEAENRKLVVAAQSSAEIAKLRQELSAERHRLDTEDSKSWATAAREIYSAEDNLVRGIFSSRQSLAQSLTDMGLRTIEQEISNDLKYLTQRELINAGILASDTKTETGGWLLHSTGEAKKTADTETNVAARDAAGATENLGFLGRVATQVGEWLGLETSKTAQTVAGATARGATAAGETAAGIAAAKAEAVAEIPAYTGIAAMGAAASVAPIPFIGPALAVAAAAQMEALGAGALSMASFDVGTNYVPYDMTAKIHAGERIIPAADNRELMGALRSGQAGGGESGGGPDVHFHIHAMDTQTGLGFIQKNMRTISNTLAQHLSSNGSSKTKFRSALT